MISLLKKIFFNQKQSNLGVCSICDLSFKDSDLKEIEGLFLCENDFEEYQKKEWILVDEGISDHANPEAALRIQNLKEQYYQQKQLKGFIKTKYFEKNGLVHTRLKLFVVKH